MNCNYNNYMISQEINMIIQVSNILHLDILSEKEITPEELVDNEDMLIRLMHEKWLYGLDDYNYKEIDENQYST